MDCRRKPSRRLTPTIGRRRRDRAGQLRLVPLREIVRRIDERPKAHVRMRQAAKLRALPRIHSRHRRDERQLVDLAGHHVALAAKLRHPEAVDDVGRFQQQANRPVDRDMQFVAGLRAVRIIEFPPPLMRDDLDYRARPSVRPPAASERSCESSASRSSAASSVGPSVHAISRPRSEDAVEDGAASPTRVENTNTRENERDDYDYENDRVPNRHVDVKTLNPLRQVRLRRERRHRTAVCRASGNSQCNSHSHSY